MAPIYSIVLLTFASLCWALAFSEKYTLTTDVATGSSANVVPVVPEVVYQFPPFMAPENAHLRSNGQLLVTCLTCAVLSQIDPRKGPTQERRTVFVFPDAVINVLGIDELSEDIFAIAVGQVDIPDPLNLTSPNVVNGPTGVWLIDLRDYQAPDYDSSKVRAHRVGGGSLGGLFDGLAVINGSNGLVATTDFVEGIIWLVDIPNNTTTILADGIFLPPSNGDFSTTLLANGLKYRDNKLYFTASVTDTFGYIPINPATGHATGPATVIYDYGFSLDDFALGPTGNVYFTTFAKPNGGILRRKADTPDGQYGTDMVVSYFATNSVIPRTVNDTCHLLMTVFLQFQIARAVLPGPC